MDVVLKAMIEKEVKYAIVGAGIAGLTAARELHKRGEEDFLIIDGRNRVGGRVFTNHGIDLGATWFNNTHTELCQLLSELDVSWFEQYNQGSSLLIYSTMTAPHRFKNDTEGVSIRRISGGSKALIDALTPSIEEKVLESCTINQIEASQDVVVLKSDNVTIRAQTIILAIPPKLISNIHFGTDLEDWQEQFICSTHTWMSNAIKFGVTYKYPFWRDKGLSGMILSQVSPAVEVYDHSHEKQELFALMGFVNEGLRSESLEERREKVLNYIAKYLGHEALDYLEYQDKDWSKDTCTSNKDLFTTYMSPSYGMDDDQCIWNNQKVVLAGTESSSYFGGYMEGAVRSGIRAARLAIEINN